MGRFVKHPRKTRKKNQVMPGRHADRGHIGVVFTAAHPDRCRTLAAVNAPVHALTVAERRKIACPASAYRIRGPVHPLDNSFVDALLRPRPGRRPGGRRDRRRRAGRCCWIPARTMIRGG